MFGVDAVVLVVVALAALAIEFVLMAVSLVDAPPPGWGKSIAATVVIFAGWVVTGAVVFSLLGLSAGNPFAGDTLPRALLGVLVVLLAMLAIPALLYVPLLPVPVKKGALAAVLQLLLRVFVYVLIAAVVAVVLAVIQIARRAEPPPTRTLLTPPAQVPPRSGERRLS